MLRILVIGSTLFASVLLASAEEIKPQVGLLWPQGAPDAKGAQPADKPTIVSYIVPAKQATGAAVVICPGGGYGHLAMGHEGHDIAKWFNSFGVSGVVVDYRHKGKGYRHPSPLQDVQRAIRTLRAGASKTGIDPLRIGVLGFSAGGHLASSAGTHFDTGDSDAKDPIQRVSCRPDFMILCYPVIAFDRPYTHRGSQRNLLGENPSDELVVEMSNERQVTSKTPPTFLFHTDEDTGVPAENSVMFYLALRKAKVPAELHVYQKGRHGLGLAKSVPGTSDWSGAVEAWMKNRGLLESKAK